MKKFCISLLSALIITTACGIEPFTTVEGMGLFVPSQSVKLDKKEKRKDIKIIRPKSGELSFGFAISELFEKLFG